jgi:hypothetical protein
MIRKNVRIGSIADQDQFRRQDTLAMSPSERIEALIHIRNIQFGAISRPIRNSGMVSYRTFPQHLASPGAAR